MYVQLDRGKVDGAWGEWTDGRCSHSCGGGTRLRERSCVNPKPMFGGNHCPGSSIEKDTCNTKPCKGKPSIARYDFL